VFRLRLAIGNLHIEEQHVARAWEPMQTRPLELAGSS
jgi:hypothetical protein